MTTREIYNKANGLLSENPGWYYHAVTKQINRKTLVKDLIEHFDDNICLIYEVVDGIIEDTQ